MVGYAVVVEVSFRLGPQPGHGARWEKVKHQDGNEATEAGPDRYEIPGASVTFCWVTLAALLSATDG